MAGVETISTGTGTAGELPQMTSTGTSAAVLETTSTGTSADVLETTSTGTSAEVLQTKSTGTGTRGESPLQTTSTGTGTRGESPLQTISKGTGTGNNEPLLDINGNILPYKGYDVQKEKEDAYYWKPNPIARLAAAASFDKPVPTAGQFGIEHASEPMPTDDKIPPECYLYDEDRPFVLGKVSKSALDYDENEIPIVPLPKDLVDYLNALEYAANQVQVALQNVPDSGGAPHRLLDTAALYETEKAKALAGLAARQWYKAQGWPYPAIEETQAVVVEAGGVEVEAQVEIDQGNVEAEVVIEPVKEEGEEVMANPEIEAQAIIDPVKEEAQAVITPEIEAQVVSNPEIEAQAVIEPVREEAQVEIDQGNLEAEVVIEPVKEEAQVETNPEIVTQAAIDPVMEEAQAGINPEIEAQAVITPETEAEAMINPVKEEPQSVIEQGNVEAPAEEEELEPVINPENPVYETQSLITPGPEGQVVSETASETAAPPPAKDRLRKSSIPKSQPKSKSKSRNTSPANKRRTPITAKTSVPSTGAPVTTRPGIVRGPPRVALLQQGKPKPPIGKSPGRGDAPAAKPTTTVSPRSSTAPKRLATPNK